MKLSCVAIIWTFLAFTYCPYVLGAYSLEHVYAGDTFFDGWSWWDNYDNLTNGATYYVPKSSSQDLAYMNEAGNIIMKVDNTSSLGSGEKRNSIRITSTATYGIGSLFVIDALHVPFGCSVWPAFWLHAVEWPSGGEIDIFEGVNLQATNQVAMHTVTGCYAPTVFNTTQTGTTTFDNCDYGVAGNTGCTVVDSRNQSYGSAFAANGGGVWAAELSSDAVNVWFFPRGSIPNDLAYSANDNSTVPDPTTWGLPVANYPNSTCNVNQYFAPQQITFNIALCGDWAGNEYVYAATCSQTQGTCTDAVMDPSTYTHAYFEVASVRVYSGGFTTTGNVSGSLDGIGAGKQSDSDNSAALALSFSLNSLILWGSSLCCMMLILMFI